MGNFMVSAIMREKLEEGAVLKAMPITQKLVAFFASNFFEF
jgi:hypothetical protein